jgi:hypothetical protein
MIDPVLKVPFETPDDCVYELTYRHPEGAQLTLTISFSEYLTLRECLAEQRGGLSTSEKVRRLEGYYHYYRPEEYKEVSA